MAGLFNMADLLSMTGLFGAEVPAVAGVAADPVTDATLREDALTKLVSGMFTRYRPGQAADIPHHPDRAGG
jgi:hypothetical protein